MSENTETTTAMERADERPITPQPISEAEARAQQRLARFSTLLAGRQDAERVAHIMAQLTTSGPVARCDRASIGEAVYTIAALGLDPSPSLGQAYIVPFGRTATPILGYKGIVTLAARAGVEVTSGIVRGSDEFSLRETSSGLHLLHETADPWDDSEETVQGAFAAFRIGGRLMHVELTPIHVGKALQAKARNGSSWKEHFLPMLRKTPIRRGFGKIPLESQQLAEVALLIAEDAQREGEAEGTGPRVTQVHDSQEALDALAGVPVGVEGGGRE